MTDFSDKPIAYTAEGRALYDNTATVVSVILFNVPTREIITIRRNTSPGKNLLALPGGFQMRGESWEEAAIREVKEEIGVSLYSPISFKLQNIITDEYKHNVLVCSYNVDLNKGDFNINHDEVTEIMPINALNFEHYVTNWAFPIHMFEAYKFLQKINN